VRFERLVLCRPSPKGDEQRFTFEEGWTVFRGGNDSGKTSLVDAILTALFGPQPDTAFSRDPDVRLELEFRSEEARYRLTRDLARGDVTLRGQGGSGEMLLFEGNAREGEGAARYRHALLGVLGFDRPEPWLRAGLVRDGALSVVPAGEGSGTTSSARSGAPTEGRTPPSEPAPEDPLQERITEARAEVAEREDRAIAAEAVAQNLSRFEQLSRERNRLEDSLLELRAERDKIRTDVEEVERQEARLEEHFGNFLDAPSDIEDRITAWTDALTTLEQSEHALAAAQAEFESLPELRTRRNALFGAALLAFAAWEYGAYTGDLLLSALFYPCGLLIGLGLGGLLDAGRRHRHHKVDLWLQECRLDRDQASFEEVKARTDLGRLSRFDSPEEIKHEYRQYLDARAEVEETRKARTHSRALSEVMNAYEDVFSELQVLDTQTRDLIAQARYLSGCDHSPEILASKLEEARKEQTEAERAAREARRTLEALEEKLSSAAASPAPGPAAADPPPPQPRRSPAADHNGGNEDDVYLPPSVSGAFRTLTGDRYREVRTGPGGEPEVRAESGWSAIHTLSRETRDQLQFVLRLARHKEVEPNLRPPVILDDAFLGWDEERLEQARELLDDLVAAGGQVIVLSSDPRVVSWAGAPIDLDGAAEAPPRLREAA